jgi:hypothetical protein
VVQNETYEIKWTKDVSYLDVYLRYVRSIEPSTGLITDPAETCQSAKQQERQHRSCKQSSTAPHLAKFDRAITCIHALKMHLFDSPLVRRATKSPYKWKVTQPVGTIWYGLELTSSIRYEWR